MPLILHKLNHAVTSFLVHIEILTTSVWLRIAFVCVEKPVIAFSVLLFYFSFVPSLQGFFSPCSVDKGSKFYIL
jgi:hypothetical protein